MEEKKFCPNTVLEQNRDKIQLEEDKKTLKSSAIDFLIFLAIILGAVALMIGLYYFIISLGKAL